MRIAWLALACSAVAVASCGRDRFDAASYNGYALTPAFAKPAVVWEHVDGTPFDFGRETAGRVTLLFFGYTHCPDVCPMQLVNIATALRQLGGDSASMVRVLFMTIDPARDTGEVLNRWLHAIDPQFVALRGPIASVDKEQARLGLAPPPDTSSKPSSDPPHASAVIAFARDDSAHFMYSPGVSPEAWAHDLRKLLRAGPR